MILKLYITSILGLNSRYTVNYKPLPSVVPPGFALRNILVEGLYLTVQPLSCPNTDTVFTSQPHSTAIQSRDIIALFINISLFSSTHLQFSIISFSSIYKCVFGLDFLWGFIQTFKLDISNNLILAIFVQICLYTTVTFFFIFIITLHSKLIYSIILYLDKNFFYS